jgi:ubiquinone/menaquinone biosynthesis C-methylase UbiE
MSIPKIKFGNPIRKRDLYLLLVFSIVSGILSTRPIFGLYRNALSIIAIILFLIFLYYLYAYFLLARSHSKLQKSIMDFIISLISTPTPQKILDFGCKDGLTTIQTHSHFPKARIIAIDQIQKNTAINLRACQENISNLEIDNQVTIKECKFTDLTFSSGEFDAVISNNTLSCIRNQEDRSNALLEMMRVLSKGGRFAINDRFFDKYSFSSPETIIQFFKNYGVQEVQFTPLKSNLKLPFPLLMPNILGLYGIIHGIK